MAEQVTIQVTENKIINVADVLGNLKITDTAPTAQGLYILSEVGTYTNLGSLVTTTGKINYAYFDGTTWSLIAKDLPQPIVNNVTNNNSYTLDPEQIVPSEALYNDETLAGDIIKRIDKNTGDNINYKETSLWYDGTSIDDNKVDGFIYIKRGSKYYEMQNEDSFVSIKKFGAKADGITDDSVVFQRAINYCLAKGKNLFLDAKTYLISNNLVIKVNDLNSSFSLLGSGDSLIKCGFNGTLITVGDASFEGTQDGYGCVEIKNINFSANGFTNAKAIDVRGQKKIHFDGLYIYGGFVDGIRLKSVYASPELIKVRIHGCQNGIRTLGQVNNIVYKSCAILGCDKGFYADSNSGSGIMSGELDTNTFFSCDFEGNQKSIFIDSPIGVQSLRIINNHFENNFGEEIYIANKNSQGVNCNISGVNISNNLFYGIHSITIGNDSEGGSVNTSVITNNVFVGGTENCIKNGKIPEDKSFNCTCYDNVFLGDESINLIDYPIAQLSTQKSKIGSGSKLPMYQVTPIEPWGNEAAGIQGDFRYKDNRLWIKTNSGWMVSQLEKVPDINTGNYPALINSGSSISAKNLKVCRTNNFASSTTINNITDGYVGQELTIIGFGDNNTTISQSPTIKLDGGNSFLLSDYRTITLICLDGNVWVEKSRSSNS